MLDDGDGVGADEHPHLCLCATHDTSDVPEGLLEEGYSREQCAVLAIQPELTVKEHNSRAAARRWDPPSFLSCDKNKVAQFYNKPRRPRSSSAGKRSKWAAPR